MINNYLNDFRVEACALFKQHQCQQHRPYTCFNWHFANQRRRRPIKKSDGSFNYSPDIYCDKYDENTGICPDGDECLYLHRVSGDVERKYHLRYYKTAQCVHPTDSKGHCMKNGAHCAFAHNNSDLRQPVFDQTHEPAYSSNMENDAKDRTSFVIEDQAWHSQDHVLSCYKTEQCRKPARLCRQGYACPFYHNSKDRRRPPALYKYRSTPCPAAKTVDEWLDPELCEAGDGCQYCHTRTEQQFHPEIYKSTKCNDMLEHGYCPRAVFCAFAHHDSELHITRTPYVLSNSPKEPSSPTTANKCADSSSSMDTSSTHCTIPSYSAVLKQKSVAHSQMNQIHQQNQTTLSTTSPKQIQQQQFAQQTQQQHLHQQQQQPPPLNINKPQLPSHFQQQQASQAQQIIPMQSTITNMAMESQYAKAPGFERCGPLSPSQDNSELGRNRTQSLNIGPMDIKTKKEYIGSSSGLDTIGTSLPTYSSFPKNENLSRSKDASNLSNTLEELSLDLAQINQHNSQSITELFSGIPCSVPFAGSESFHTSPINNFTDNLFSTNKSNSPSSMFGFENQVAIWEEGLKQARQACEAWRSEAQHYKTKAEHIEMERNRACFERDQLAQQLESLKLHLTSFGNLGLPVSQLSSNQNPNNVLNTQNDFGEIRASNIHMSNAQQSFSMFSNDEEKYFCHRCGRKKDSNSACTFCV